MDFKDIGYCSMHGFVVAPLNGLAREVFELHLAGNY